MQTLPAGTYFIGDPCYIWPHDEKLLGLEWIELLEKTDYLQDFCGVISGHKLFAHGTAYGDGTYALEENGSNLALIPVDAGLIGVIPEAFIEASSRKDDSWTKEAYFKIEAASEVDVGYHDGEYSIHFTDTDGRLRILSINTN